MFYILISATTILLISLWDKSNREPTLPALENLTLATSSETASTKEISTIEPKLQMLRPEAEPTLTDQELLELSAEDDSQYTKPNTQKTDALSGAAAIPTTAPRATLNTQTETDTSSDDARSLFAPLSENANIKSINTPSDFVRGGRSGRQSDDSSRPTTPTPASTATPDTALPWVSGQARGYAMLYATHPRARAVVEKQVETLLKARIREPYISVLIDGTFANDFDYIENIIKRLSADGRRLTLGLYISNGPTMRIWDKTPIRTDFSTTEPSEFRYLIQADETVRNQYAELVNIAQRLFEFNLLTNRSNKNIAVPMLEDNLDRDSYLAARSIAATQLDSLVKFARNPCEGCYSGNNGEALGDILEEHRTSYLNQLSTGDGFTLDGLGFTYPDTTGQTGLTPQKLNELIDATLQQSLAYFGLWRHGWQGVIPRTANVHPDKRNYIPSTDAEAEFEITTLRRGLTVEDNKTKAAP